MNWWINANIWMMNVQYDMACYMLSVNRYAPYWQDMKNEMESELIRYQLMGL